MSPEVAAFNMGAHSDQGLQTLLAWHNLAEK